MNVVLSVVFVVVGLVLGGVVAIFIGHKNEKILSVAENLASGFMLAVVFFDLMPQTFEYAGLFLNVIGLLLGITTILLISAVSLKNVYTNGSKYAIIKNKIACLCSANTNNSTTASKSSKKLIASGYTTLIAVALHNIPEGIAIGSLASQNLALSTAILIGLHNIPEGVAMCLPLAKIGVKWNKTLLFAFLTSLATAVGAMFGYLMSDIDEQVIALFLSFSSGAMLQIVFGDILADSSNQKTTSFLIVGLLVGMIIAKLI